MTGALLGSLAVALTVPLPAQMAVISVLVVCALWVAVAWFLADDPASAVVPGVRPRLRGLGALAVVALGTGIIEGAPADWGAVYLEGTVGARAAVAGLGYTVFAGAMLVGRMVADRFVHRFGRAVVVRVGSLLGVAGFFISIGRALRVGCDDRVRRSRHRACRPVPRHVRRRERSARAGRGSGYRRYVPTRPDRVHGGSIWRSERSPKQPAASAGGCWSHPWPGWRWPSPPGRSVSAIPSNRWRCDSGIPLQCADSLLARGDRPVFKLISVLTAAALLLVACNGAAGEAASVNGEPITVGRSRGDVGCTRATTSHPNSSLPT